MIALDAPPARFEVTVPPPAGGDGTQARAGRLTTPHGPLETPTFMPVGTNATVKALDADDLREVGARMILANTYHLYLRPGHERIAALGGLHRFMGWDGPILTDSGGFQVVSLAALRSIDEGGVTFRSHLDGSTHRFTPELAIAVQEALGPDVAVALDQPVPPHASSRAQVAEATARTARWAERCLRAHGRPDQALFGIIQGGLEADLRAESTRAIAGLAFDGLCIGGLAGDETPAERRAALDVVVGLLAADPRPRYLMGLGSPLDLLDAVDAGIDLFDSVLPARLARHARLWTPEGELDLRHRRFRDDPAPVQADCPCRLCRTVSRAYLAHLFRARELLAYRLATCHNLTFSLDFMARIRRSIGAGTFPELRHDLLDRARRPAERPSSDRQAGAKAEWSDREARPSMLTVARGGARDGQQEPPPPRAEEEAEGRGGQAEAPFAPRRSTTQRGGHPTEAQATGGTGAGGGVTPAGPRRAARRKDQA
ncbi:MAG TPA: tRNA guanosine(34) transglycosylase Tgt [Candidatus Limnocylindrales bacterium]|nr:tRNA guanosine(34) transglycosylase Tgt [Candidatus Limnocylindrales bacterium]